MGQRCATTMDWQQVRELLARLASKLAHLRWCKPQGLREPCCRLMGMGLERKINKVLER